jgi:predicted PurR-regulated permease PerM
MNQAVIPPPGTKPFATTASEAGTIRFNLSFKSLLAVVAVIAAVWALLHVLPALLVLVTALMLVGALNPLVGWLERHQTRRFLAISVVFGLVVVITIALIVLTVPTVIDQLQNMANNEPAIREKVASYLDQSPLTATLADDLRNVQYAELLKSSKITLVSVSARVLELIAYSVATVFLAFYIMLDRDRLRGALFAVVPRGHHIRLSRILLNLETIVGGYIRGQAFTCALMSAFLVVLLMACRVPNALAIAVFGGVMDLLPYIGIFLTMAPAVLAATVKGPAITAVVFALLFAYEEFEGRILIPIVYGRALRLPSSVVFFALLVGTTLAGIAGALLALPIAAAVVMLVDELRVELPGATTLPEDIRQRREEDRTEQEYERRTDNVPVAKAAAIAVKIADQQKKVEEAEKARAATEEKDPPTGSP